MDRMPKWADVILIPLFSLFLAALISALVIWAIGENPLEAVRLMVDGAFGNTRNIGYTLYYATNFIFTGLAVSVAFHARLFNIGGEGQALLGGLGIAYAMLYVPWPHWTLAILGGALASAAFGAAWAAIPAYLQARRGSHIVITTIMFNFIAAALLNYMLVNPLKAPGAMEPATLSFPEATHLPNFQTVFDPLWKAFAGPEAATIFQRSPANVTFFLALVASVAVWALIWRSRLGYEIRAFGWSQPAARYAGYNATRITVVTMLISGGLAGMMAVNQAMGDAERLVLNAAEGAGFIGIAVALMGRNHPFGVFLAALLFGALYQGGAELAFWTAIPREMIVVIQGLVILFTGALDNMVRMPLERVFGALRRPAKPGTRSAQQGPAE